MSSSSSKPHLAQTLAAILSKLFTVTAAMARREASFSNLG
ncbi:hypothetical protein COLO4_20627 [Corchorus olitorius]|uniref:Uncharacterized protein n=1 Tax=Corchorus olitorius TaxID=93759 RepID=A0A1R3IYJ8_9ROSI|nr:hypothetical protein COLO4_20627 [Corchorus olitorius]